MTAAGATFYTTAKANTARFSAVGVGAMLPILLLLVCLLHYGEGQCPKFSRWCRRYAAHFTAVGAALCTAARVYAALLSAVCVKLPFLPRLAFVLSFKPLLGWMLPSFLMRLVWTFPCRCIAATLDSAFLLQLLWTPPSILLLGWILPLCSGC